MSSAAKEIGIQLHDAKKLVSHGLLCRAWTPDPHVMVTAKSLAEFLAKWRDEKLMDIDIAAEMVNENKLQFIRRWVATGIVAKEDLCLKTRVNLTDVRRLLKLKRQYIQAPDAVRQFGFRPYTLPNFEVQGRLQSKRLGAKGCVRLYRRDDIEKLAASLSQT